MSKADWVYVKIKGKDSWCNDAIDYTLTASIDSNDRDTDEDGYIDTEDSTIHLEHQYMTERAALTATQMVILTQKLDGAQTTEVTLFQMK